MKEVINSNEEDDQCVLNDAQKAAIDRALEDVANGKVHLHEDVMQETKKRFPYLVGRI